MVLFLLRNGDGAAALAQDATSLWSTTLGSDVDPERLAEVDVEAERSTFEENHGRSPTDWLIAWRAGTVEQTGVNFATAYRAMLLEKS